MNNIDLYFDESRESGGQLFKGKVRTRKNIADAEKALAIIQNAINQPCCGTGVTFVTSRGSRNNEFLNILKPLLKNSNTPMKVLIKIRKSLERYIYGCCANIVMQNLLGAKISTYPVGVFNVNGAYLGTATDQNSYIKLWNSDPSNSAVAILDSADNGDPYSFTAFLKSNSSSISAVTGLNYLTIAFSNTGTIKLDLDNNAIVVDSANNIYHSNNGTQYASNSGNNLLWGYSNINWTITDVFNYREVDVPYPVAKQPIYVFHNNTDIVFGTELFSSIVTSISGNMPTGVKYVGMRGDNKVNYNGITNGPQLTNIRWWINWHAGGGITNSITDAAILPLPSSPSVKGLYYGQSVDSYISPTLFWINNKNFATLDTLNLDYNGAWLLQYDAQFWQNIPKVTDSLTVFSQGGGGPVPSAVADAIWNQLAVSLQGVVPSGAYKILRIAKTSTSVTAASLAARNYLAAQGWNVVLT